MPEDTLYSMALYEGLHDLLDIGFLAALINTTDDQSRWTDETMSIALGVFARLAENRHAVLGKLGTGRQGQTCVVAIIGLKTSREALKEWVYSHGDPAERSNSLSAELTPDGRTYAERGDRNT